MLKNVAIYMDLIHDLLNIMILSFILSFLSFTDIAKFSIVHT